MPSYNVDFAAAFKNMGLDFGQLGKMGVVVAATTNGIKFAKDGGVIASLPIPPGKISELATSFDPDNSQHQTLKASVQKMLLQLDDKVNGKATVAPATKEPDTVVLQGVETFPISSMGSAMPVQLSAATKIFQPVKGTSQGSRYYVVGLGNGLRVAARYKNKQLSIRVEGEGMPKLQTKLVEAGVFGPEFAGSFKANYASMHLSVEDKIAAQRVVGAVLGSLAPVIINPTPDIQPIVEAA